MSKREILAFPDPGLRAVSEPVEDFASLRDSSLVDDLVTTVRAAGGVGLAAVQVGAPLRVFVVDVGGRPDSDPLVCVNPVVVWSSPETVKEVEGCLSVRGASAPVERSRAVRVQAEDVRGGVFYVEGEGMLARVLQHELDHLDGRLFVDAVGPVARDVVLRRVRKLGRKRGLAAAPARRDGTR